MANKENVNVNVANETKTVKVEDIIADSNENLIVEKEPNKFVKGLRKAAGFAGCFLGGVATGFAIGHFVGRDDDANNDDSDEDKESEAE